MGVGTTRGELTEVRGEKPLERQEDNKRRKEDFKHRPWIKEKEKPEKLLFGNNGGQPGRKPNFVYSGTPPYYHPFNTTTFLWPEQTPTHFLI